MKFYSNIVIYKLAFAGHVRGSSAKLIVLEGKSMRKNKEEDQEGIK